MSLAAGALCLVLAAGCATGKNAEHKIASVTITGHSESAVRLTLIDVFQNQGFQTRDIRGAALVFEQPVAGTLAMQPFYTEGRPVLQARVTVSQHGPNALQVRCYPQIVTHPGDRIDRSAFALADRARFQRLLNRAKAQLQ